MKELEDVNLEGVSYQESQRDHFNIPPDNGGGEYVAMRNN